ncbi:MAG: ferrous iron transport protein A [Clostridium argentinense]|uniref:Ferrous iron transport protein A n=1 Tax=Clostridium faecium TaxID=2762223 RepID=A0ABR8YT06_9CLOT|nr:MULTISPECIES: FeoA family protein [Clostridium]MBD8047398.1 ferrous iron transport protein A [Clostridium faecium]MBS5822996.1 ferrous iron transport protein A [Clostridium argentinense]MDU1349786.1 FeoA family protein [Clostridium argentinense]
MEVYPKKLSEVKVGTIVTISEVLSEGLSKQRLLDLGFVPNTELCVLREAPLGEPTAYFIRDTCIALRREEADNILVYEQVL